MHLAAIWLYPIKSLDGISVSTAEITTGGSLAWDRAWVLVDTAGKFINAKNEPRIHHIRSQYDLVEGVVTLSAEGFAAETIALQDASRIAAWCSRFFERPVHCEYNPVVGFPDDLDSPGPTVISQASLELMANWFPGVDAEGMRRRLRPNLILDDCEAFAEERFFGREGERVPFTVGDVQFLGNNPCQRCVVPTRDPLTGVATANFQKQFAQRREATFPAFVQRDRFTHFYRASVNTVLPASERGKVVRVGMSMASA